MNQISPRRGTSEVCIANIHIGTRRRALDEQAVGRLMDTIEHLGLRTPITVTQPAEGPLTLVAGWHRLEAMRRLGHALIEAFVTYDEPGDDEVALWELAENLARHELSQSERDEHIRAWFRIVKAKGAAGGTLSRQPHDVGISRAARELGQPRIAISEALKLGALTEQASQAAEEKGLPRKARLKVASEPPDRQVETINAIAAERLQSKLLEEDQRLAEQLGISVRAARYVDQSVIERSGGVEELRQEIDEENAQLRNIVDAWNKAGGAAQSRFAEEMSSLEGERFPILIPTLSVL